MMPARFLAARRCARLVREGSARYNRLDMKGAETLLRAALSEAERSGRPRHIARASQSLYFVLRRQGRDCESAEALERTVEAHRRLNGADGRWTAEWRNELIELYGRLGRCAELEVVCREHLACEERLHGQHSAEAAWALLTLAWALQRAERWDESEGLCRRALALIEAIFGAEHPRTGWALIALALTVERLGDPGEAESALKRARSNWERVGHADRVAAVDELLIDLYVRQRRHADALELAAAGFDGRALSSERRLCRVERQAALLRAVGRPDEAAGWDEEAWSLRVAIEQRRRQRERIGHEAPDTPEVTSCAAAWLAGPVFSSPLL